MKLRIINLKALTVALLISTGLLQGCFNINQIDYGLACRVPEDLETTDIIGTWHIEYNNYSSTDTFDVEISRISGREKLVFSNDGTYQQSFQSRDYDYESPNYEWELVQDKDEGPKLRMHNLKFFAYGVDNIETSMELSAQLGDLLRYQDIRLSGGRSDFDTSVDYPRDGYVYLYPRFCLGDSVLMQMTSDDLLDPDAPAINNPVFTRVE